MRNFTVQYPTCILHKNIGETQFVLEAIRDLDEAIELICAKLSPEEQMDSFAEDLCPYFGVLWPSAEGLSIFISEHQEIIKNKSILELGCGLGLPSLVAKSFGAKVLATDFHPDVETYFKRNCQHSGIDCDYLRLNWREEKSNLGEFDLVMGSDLLYESQHPKEIVSGLTKFLKPDGKILLSDPGRAYLKSFLKAMQEEGYSERTHTQWVEGKEIFVYLFTKTS